MLYLEAKGSHEPLLLLSIMKEYLQLDSNLSEKECNKIIIYKFMYDGQIKSFTEQNIKHELGVLAELGFKY